MRITNKQLRAALVILGLLYLINSYEQGNIELGWLVFILVLVVVFLGGK